MARIKTAAPELTGGLPHNSEFTLGHVSCVYGLS
jgi:hypothetical protein